MSLVNSSRVPSERFQATPSEPQLGAFSRSRCSEQWRAPRHRLRHLWEAAGAHEQGEVIVVHRDVCQHEVDGDDGGQDVYLTHKDKGHGHQAGQADGSYGCFTWPFLQKQK